MKDTDKNQIKSIIENYENSRETIPYLSNLEEHATFGPVFKSLAKEEKADVEELIESYIKKSAESLKTKGGQLFKRFYENQEEKFRQFRHLNESEESVKTEEFQKLGKEIEQEMFNLENILTHNMLNRAEGLGKTIDAFYTIVYKFFPLYGEIE